jgi:cytochrome b6-f complex iron-sulfur subunit
MTRKGFIQRILSAWAAICSLPLIYALIRYLVPPVKAAASKAPVQVGKISEFTPGSVRLVKEGRTALFVTETDSGQIRSFSAKCTHLGCLVDYLEERKIYRCNCHGSTFDIEGKNLSGPAVKPLQPYRVEVRGDDILVNIV